MDRRGFLSLLATALVLDPEKLLWVPGAKMISIPAPRIVAPDPLSVAALQKAMRGLSQYAIHPTFIEVTAFGDYTRQYRSI